MSEPTDELVTDLTRHLTARAKELCPTIPEAALEELRGDLLAAFRQVADEATEAERKRLRPGGWA